MRLRKWYAIPVLLAFILTSIWLMPLSFVLRMAGVSDAGLQWSHSAGNIRAGKLTSVRLGDQDLGNLDLTWQPSSLLFGSLGYKAVIRGPAMTAQSQVRFGFGGVGVEGLTGRVDLASVLALPANIKRTEGVLSLDDISVAFRDGACRKASGRAASNVMTQFVAPFGVAGSELEGEAGCDGAVLSIPLRGTLKQTEDVILYLRGGGGIAANIDIIVNTQDAVLSTALTSRNFKPTDTGVRAYYEIRFDGRSAN